MKITIVIICSKVGVIMKIDKVQLIATVELEKAEIKALVKVLIQSAPHEPDLENRDILLDMLKGLKNIEGVDS